MRIVLANPPWSEPGYYGVRAGSRWPHLEHEKSHYMPFPFFLAYTTALLEKHGFFPILIDAIAERLTMETFLYQLEKSAPDLIILEVSTPSFPQDLKTLALIREHLGSDMKIALCGPNHLMTSTEFLLKVPEVDFVFRGEYEFLTLELVHALQTGTDLRMIPGLNFRNRAGEIQINEARQLLNNIDVIPWPSRHQLPMMNYYDEAGGIVQPGVQMWGSRGCPYMCIFCVWPQLVYGGPSYRVRNPSDVADEMAWLVRTYDFKSVYFDDDTFNIGKQRMLTLCDEIEKRNLCVPWAIMARADGIDREVLERMKQVGLYSIKYGIESGDQTIVNGSNKKLNLKEARDIIHITRELGIQYHLTFTFGLPGETHVTAQRTIEMALELDPATVQFSLCTPMPGSRYFDMAKERGLLQDVDWTHYTGFTTAVIRTEQLTSVELEEILNEAQSRWYRHVEARERKTKTSLRLNNIIRKLKLRAFSS